MTLTRARRCTRADGRTPDMEKGGALLETVLIFPVVLVLLMGFLALTELGETIIHLTHASRSAAREYMKSQDIRLSRAFVYRSIDNGGCPLEKRKIKIYIDGRGKGTSGDSENIGLFSRLRQEVFEASAGVKIVAKYEWGGISFHGIAIPPMVLEQNCTVLAGSWKLCSD